MNLLNKWKHIIPAINKILINSIILPTVVISADF